MQSLIAIALFVAGVALTIFVGLLKDEAAAWLPKLTEAVLRVAVRRAPEETRKHYAEEWPAYIAEFPGKLAQLLRSILFLYAAGALKSWSRDRRRKYFAVVTMLINSMAAIVSFVSIFIAAFKEKYSEIYLLVALFCITSWIILVMVFIFQRHKSKTGRSFFHD